MQPVEIRVIDKNDFDRWLPLWKSYQRFYEVDIPDAATRTTWERFLDPREPMHAALAVVDGKVCGLAHWIYHRSTWMTQDYCYLQDLFVDGKARGGGIGRALIEHVYTDAQQRDAARVYWLTHESNHDAMKLYDRIAERAHFIQYRKYFP